MSRVGSIALGIGCDRGTPLATVQTCLHEALAQLGATPADIVAVASVGGHPVPVVTGAYARDSAEIHVFRRDELMRFEVELRAPLADTARLAVDPDAGPTAIALREAWLA